jgi:hypothetical protein
MSIKEKAKERKERMRHEIDENHIDLVLTPSPIWFIVSEYGIGRIHQGSPNMEELQEAVEGYFTPISLDPFYSRELMMMYDREVSGAYVNEEGILRNMNYNPHATAFCNYQILGPMVVTFHPKMGRFS